MLPLSYIIPAYNCSATIAESVASIVDCNLAEDDEIVIVDDGSTDETRAVLAELSTQHSSIRLVEHARNRGGGAARNTAVANARHDVIFCLDSDNILMPGSVAPLRHFMAAEKADVVTFREVHYFKNEPSSTTHIWRYPEGRVTLADHLAGDIVPGASGNYLFTRESWSKAGTYPEFAGALDTWGFGLRQIATGQRMLVNSSGFYRHRFGHDSYWVRESANGQLSLIALQLLVPFLDQLNDEDVTCIMSRDARRVWLGDLDRRPVRGSNGERGQAGSIVNIDEQAEPPADTIAEPTILSRLLGWLR